ncbi:MAG: redoxin domain-containing protein [Deltaproteobacteria bacterium]|nr:MAG: redoxin domain-containing protein [Deltaproteobacteria bacterium]
MTSLGTRHGRCTLLVLLCGAFLWWGCPSEGGQVKTGPFSGSASGASKMSEIKDGETAPSFSLKDLGGRSHSLSQYKGKVVLVNFWATWCEPCKKEFPHFQGFLDKYRKQGFEILAISIDEGRSVSAVGPTVRRLGYNFTTLLDTEGRVVGQFNPKRHCPYSALVDRKGRIRLRHEGYNPGDEVPLEKLIVRLLQEK